MSVPPVGGEPAGIRRASLPAVAMALAVALVGCAGVGDDGTDDSGAASGLKAARSAPAAEIRSDQLLGFDADRLTAALGPADFRRADGPAEIWQYWSGDCVVDLYLYADAATGAYRVAHVEARERLPGASGGEDCATTRLRQRDTQTAG